ncbi:MAG: DUF4870 domain-containing protein [Planctomycetes bacterium]|nr:DUF4870 domain-containing protein [Planctomycetota bacterium]
MDPIPSEISPEEKNWGMLAHLLTLLGYAVLLGHWIPPLVIYLTKKDTQPFAAGEARESLNFQITVFLAYVLPLPLLCLVVTIPLIILWWIGVAILHFVLPILAAVKAADGVPYRYPWTLRLLS